MGKKSGSQTSTTTTQLPAWVDQAAQDYLSQAKTASRSLQAPYQGQVVADINPMQSQAIQRMGELSNFSLTPETIQGQMNPYIQNVEQAALAQGQRALSQNLNQIADAGIRAGSAFGSRQGVMEGAAAAENAMNQANLSAQLRQQGYQQAVQNALTNQQAQLQGAQAAYGAGSSLQQQEQARLAAQEAQYNAMRGYPLEQLDIVGQALGMTPYGKSTVASTPTSSSPAMGILGGAMSGAQLGSMIPGIGTGIGALGGAVLGGFGSLSDPSMKTDVQKIGRDKATGLNMYAYRYKGDPKSYPKVVGPMADEIEDKYPDQVKRVAGKRSVNSGFLMGKVGYNG